MRMHQPSRGGAAVTVVALLLLLGLISVSGAFQIGRMVEMLVGSSSDMARTRAAADALLRDAETDILGSLPSYEVVQPSGRLGYPCRPTAAGSLTPAAGAIGCRVPGGTAAAPVNPWFPYNWAEYQQVVDLVRAANAQGCLQGICAPQTTPIEDQLATMTALGATYGEHTRSGMTAPGVSGNPVLGNASGWYWIEVFQYQPGAAAPAGLALPSAGFVPLYRITVVANGVRAGTRVVLKSWFSPMATPAP